MTLQTPDSGAGAPPVDPDAAKYAALAKELGVEQEQETQQEQAPEPRPEPEPAQEQRAKPEHVPYGEHENVQKALREARENAKRSDERFAQVMQLIEQTRAQRQPAEAKEPPKIPSELDDPIGHFKAVNAQLTARLEQIEQGGRMTAEQFQAYQQQQQFHSVVVRAEQEINDPKSAGYKADYWDAVGHLEATRVKELERMYPDHPYAQQQAQQMGFNSVAELRQAVLNNDRQQVATQALQMGVSPAELYYSLALDRGYQAKPAVQRAPNGQFVPAEKAQQQIEAAKRGRSASMSISGDSGGRKGAKDMSQSDLAELFIEDADEADKVWEQMKRQGLLG